MQRKFYRVVWLVGIIWTIGACGDGARTAFAQGTNPSAIEAVLLNPDKLFGDWRYDAEELRRFYKNRNFSASWSGSDSAKWNATFALAALQYAELEGLRSSDYHYTLLKQLHTRSGATVQADFDVLLSAALLSYMRDVRTGKANPARSAGEVGLEAFDAAGALEAIIVENRVEGLSTAVAPPHEEYAVLKAALSRYRYIRKQGGWPVITGRPDGTLKAGDSRLSVLRQRLAVEAYLPAKQDGETTMEQLADALRRFQASNGLEQTGGLGPRTFAALNVPVATRIEQIIANMERWRWLPSFEATYVEIDAGSTILKAVTDGSVVLESRIIAGRRDWPTPIFSAAITGVTVNPVWVIPPSIAEKEILPKEARSPGYMASQGISADSADGLLRQEPGPANALGRIKLEMPNKFGVYLHDTPARALFASDERHLSHGCMRVEQVLPLASWVLTGNAAAALESLNAQIASGVTTKIALDKPIPVYVDYWTVVADKDGTVGFRPDVYGRDRKLLAALAGQNRASAMALNTYCQAASAG